MDPAVHCIWKFQEGLHLLSGARIERQAFSTDLAKKYFLGGEAEHSRRTGPELTLIANKSFSI